MAERLQSINPDAQIDYHTEFLNPDNIEEMLNGHDVAINALDLRTIHLLSLIGFAKKEKSQYCTHTTLVGLALLRL